MVTYLSEDSKIVQSPEFEKALLSLSKGNELSGDEKRVLSKMMITGSAVPSISSNSSTSASTSGQPRRYAIMDKAISKRRKLEPQMLSEDVDIISPTSNVCERLFSRAKYIRTDNRRAMLPVTMEMILFLRLNRDFWSIIDVQNALENRLHEYTDVPNAEFLDMLCNGSSDEEDSVTSIDSFY